MTKDIKLFSTLTEVKTFDPKIFEANEQISQDVCDFVLALACIYNDNKDLLMGFHYLDCIQPPLPSSETSKWGEFNGLKFHLIRLHLSLVYELLYLIETRGSVLSNPPLKEIIDNLDSIGKQNWNTLCEASSGRADTSRGKMFLMIRNKIGYHYDPKEIFKGYKKWFLDGKKSKKPYISLGKTLNDERYYFAEASAQSYYNKLFEDNKGSNEEQVKKIALSVYRPISQIVKMFIKNRSPVKGNR